MLTMEVMSASLGRVQARKFSPELPPSICKKDD